MQINIEAEKKKIEREYSRLQKYFADFTQLKQTISALVANAPADLQAQQKLNQLQDLFPAGIGGLEQEMKQDMKILNVALKKLEAQIKHRVIFPEK